MRRILLQIFLCFCIAGYGQMGDPDSCRIMMIDSSLTTIVGNRPSGLALDNEQIRNILDKRQMPFTGIEFTRLANEELSEMTAFLDYTCRLLHCNKSDSSVLILLKDMQDKLQLVSMSLFDSTNTENNIFCLESFCAFADFMVNGHSTLKFRLYYSANEIDSGLTGVVFLNGKQYLRYAVGAYNSFNQYLTIGDREETIVQLHVYDEEMDDEPSFISIDRACY